LTLHVDVKSDPKRKKKRNGALSTPCQKKKMRCNGLIAGTARQELVVSERRNKGKGIFECAGSGEIKKRGERPKADAVPTRSGFTSAKMEQEKGGETKMSGPLKKKEKEPAKTL